MAALALSPDDLRIFLHVARLSSFTRAAQQLSVPRATVSTAVQRLEARLGARLLQRTTRQVHLTADGEHFLARCEEVLEGLEALASLFSKGGEHVGGRLRVDMPLGMATGSVMAKLPEFIGRFPNLQVEVFSTDRRVNVIADGFDCVIRAGQVVDESLSCRPLGRMALVNVVSPGYVGANGVPNSLAELSAHWLINYQPNPDDAPSAFEYHCEQTQRSLRVSVKHRVTVNNSAAYEAACRAGLGIAQIPRFSAVQGVEEGVLVEVLPAFRPAPMPINILFPHRRHMPVRVRIFADWVAEQLRLAPYVD